MFTLITKLTLDKETVSWFFV